MTATGFTWMRDAQCNGVEHVEFVPDDPEPLSEPPAFVRLLCSRCTVRSECLAFGIETDSTGWWGGEFVFQGQRTVRVRRGKVALLAKDHHNSGERHGNAKVTDADVHEIRRRYAEGGVTMRELAEAFGIAKSNVSQIVNFRRRNRDPLASLSTSRAGPQAGPDATTS